MEIETRVKINNVEETRQKLIGLGVRFHKKVVQIDRYFKERGKEKGPQGPGSSLLRLRDAGGECVMAIKTLTEQQGVWDEHETKVGDAVVMERILDALGYVCVLTVTKEREDGALDGITFCLDTIRELGHYLEVEICSNNVKQAKERISLLLAKLGYSQHDLEHRGYVRILMEQQGVQYKSG